jgi:hypothetical protein
MMASGSTVRFFVLTNHSVSGAPGPMKASKPTPKRDFVSQVFGIFHSIIRSIRSQIDTWIVVDEILPTTNNSFLMIVVDVAVTQKKIRELLPRAASSVDE